MAIEKIMGSETELGITAARPPASIPSAAPSSSSTRCPPTSPSAPCGTTRGRTRCWMPAGSRCSGERERPRPAGQPGHQQGAPQRRPPVRGRRPSRVLHARDHQRARPGALREGGRADRRPVPRGGQPEAPAPPATGHLQEQQRRQGEQLRLPRELPGGAAGPLREAGGGADRISGVSRSSSAVRARWGRRTGRSPATTRCPSGPTSSRP